MTHMFGRAWKLLCANPVIIVPSLAVGAIGGAAAYVLSANGLLSWAFYGDLDAQGPTAFWAFFGTIVAVALRIAGAVLAIAFTAGMAGAAWKRGTATLRDGAAAFRKEGLQALVALVILFCLGFIASTLALPTFFLSILGYMVFFLYAIPAVVVGDRPATEAIIESIGLAWRNFGVTLLLVVMIVVLAVAGGFAGSLAGRVPFLGEIIAWIVMEAVVGYVVLVAVGEYLKLRGTPTDAPLPEPPNGV